MKIHFKLNYFTQWGQNIAIMGSIPELSNNDPSKALYMNYEWKEDWLLDIDVQRDAPFELTYKYVLKDTNGLDVLEWGDDRTILVDPLKDEHVYCYDSWNPAGAVENVFMTSPFQNVLFKENHIPVPATTPKKYTHIFRVKAPTLKKGEALCVVGGSKELGDWASEKPVVMTNEDANWWVAKVNLSTAKVESVNYKYGVYDLEDQSLKYFEYGSDRKADIVTTKKSLVIVSDSFARIGSYDFKGAGVGIPVFSIRTKSSFGVGDFIDIKLMVDWAKKVGLKLIQVLPLNDTIGTHTAADVLPYAAISAFALSPLYLNLPKMGKLPADNPLNEAYKTKQKELNDLPLVEFLEIVNFKLAYSKALYLENKEKFLKNKSYLKFFKENKHWLVSYAAFCYLRDKNGTADHSKWGEYATFSEAKLERLTSPEQAHFDDIAVNYFIQYHLHLQLLEAAEYAHENGVILKGDIPIGVNRNSVDTWVAPDLYHMHMQAGAPPDMFAIKGQNWELPTYNWEKMEATGFDWWKKRFEQMGYYFDTFRIDHILGFFRIWQIPLHQEEGIMGYLNPSIPVHINEFGEKGVHFDYNRFCVPFITDAVLWEVFGDDANWVKTNCIDIIDGWILRLKPICNTQKKVMEMFDKNMITEKVKWGLFDLISNVLFFEVEWSNGMMYYPRYGMQTTTSFRYLDNFTKNKIEELYVDYFYRRQDSFWKYSALKKLPAIKRSTNMMICGEDLGMMADCVTSVMNELGILSLEIQRAPKIDTIEFFHPADAKYLSVVTPSTHDMSTIRGWWEEDREVTQRFYNQQLGHWGEAPYFAEWWVCRDMIVQHLYSPAMWAIFQLQDLLSMSDTLRHQNPHEERINVPSNSKHSWRYRMHLTMEELLEQETFNKDLKNYIVQANR